MSLAPGEKRTATPRGMVMAVGLFALLATGVPVGGEAPETGDSVAAALAELPALAETIDVRAVNVDVVVSDARGVPITGLTRDDFQLLVDGKPTEIKYFAAIDEQGAGATGSFSTGTQTSAEGTLAADQRPFLVILIDGRSLRPGEGRRTFDELMESAEQLVGFTRGVMVARHGRGLRLGHGFTRDPAVLRANLDRLRGPYVPAADLGGREMLMRRMEMAQAPGPSGDEFADLIGSVGVESDAVDFLNEIRGVAEVERVSSARLYAQLRTFVRALSGLSGRKSILYLGPGLQTRPGEVLYRLWWDKYRRIAPKAGVDSIDSEVSRHDLHHDLVDTIVDANAHRVSIYSYDPLGVRNLASSARFDSLAATLLSGDEQRRAQNALVSLATGTGGIGRHSGSSIGDFVDQMVTGFRSFYSLGFEPLEGKDGDSRIKVRLRGKKHSLRYLGRFAKRTPTEKLEERALATLLTDTQENPLAVVVDMEKPERQRDGSLVVPVMVKVPISRLTLVPRTGRHVGRLSFVIIAQADSGDLSEPARGQVPIEIANGDLMASLSAMAGYRMQLRVARGEQKLAIAVRDDVTGIDSMINLVIDPQQDA